MKYLLDTNVLVALIRRRASPVLLRRVAATVDQQAVSSVTLAELAYGAHRSGVSVTHALDVVDEVVGNLPVLAFDREAAYVFGELRVALDRRGEGIGLADTQIAATALCLGLTVVTANTRHFERVPGLAVENWLEA